MNDDDLEELREIVGFALADGADENEIARRLYTAGFRRAIEQEASA